MFGAIKGFIAIIGVMAVAIIGLLILNVVQLQRGTKAETIVITATPQPMPLAQALQTPVAPVSGTAMPSAAPMVVATALPMATATTVPTVTPAPTATPVPTPTPTPKPGDVLYQANWTTSPSGFAGPGWTNVSGMFVSDGSSGSGDDFLVASYQPPSIDYAIEAEVQIVGKDSTAACGIGIFARGDDKGAIRGGIGCPGTINYKPGLVIATDRVDRGRSLNNGDIASQVLPIDTGWHTYRLEVKGNSITFSIDGQARITAMDNTYLKMGKIGMIGHRQCSVRNFKVLAV